MSRCDNPRFCRGANLAVRGALRSTHVSRHKTSSMNPATTAPPPGDANPPRCPRVSRPGSRAHPAARPSISRASSRDDGASPEPPARAGQRRHARRRDRATRTGTRRPPRGEFARVLREDERATRAMETRWTQGGLRPRVVHESTSDWIRRVAFDWPNAVMGTAAGSVLRVQLRGTRRRRGRTRAPPFGAA